MCKSHDIDCLIKELGITIALFNPTYTPTTLTKEAILDNHGYLLCFFGITTKDEQLDLPSLYWIPLLHKGSCKQCYVAGSAKCSTKPLSKLLTEGQIKGVGPAVFHRKERRYKYLVLERDIFYFAKKHSDSTKKKTDIINMLEFLVDNIFAIFGGMVCNRQSAYIWVQTVLLFSPTCFLLVSGRLHPGTSHEKRKETNLIL